MIEIHKTTFISKQLTIKILRDYILDAELTEADTIVINPVDYDEIALEYSQTYKEHLPFSYLLIRVLIRPDERIVRSGIIGVIENDTESLRVDPNTLFDPNRIIYRCHNCGSLVGPDGEELERKEVSRNADYLNRFGNRVPVEHKYGVCCVEVWNSEKATFKPSKREVDYTTIESKELMQLTEDDFKGIELTKGETPNYKIIYSCRNNRNVKIYFTPNENSYSLRGYMLEEYEEIFSTEELIKAIRNWRKD